ncbi:MAG TPA: hypothetical protein VFO60_03560, partial [Candidatus Dormibacteraeota bacterium]|nr:hypothetical protein [Candidatus Dormibacteraeota bacterium]
ARESETLAASAAAAGRLAGEAADRAAAGRDARAGAEAGHAVAAAALREAEARAAAIHGQVAGVLGGGAVDAAVARGDVAASRLVEAFRVLDPSDHAAVEAALEGHLGAWLTADVDAAVAALRGGRAREEVLAAGLEVPGDAPAEPSAGLPPGRAAATALDADPAASGALALLLEGAWLVDGLEAARAAIAAGAAQAVLADGTVVTAAGIRVGGRPGEALALAAAEQEAQERLLAVRADAARAAAELEAADTAANAMARDLEAAASRADVARAAAAAAAARAAGARAAREAEEERGAALVAEQASRQVAAGAAREAAAVAGAEAEWAAAAIRPVEERLAAAAAVSDARRTDVAAAEDALRAHDLETARAEPRARDMRQRIDAARDAAARAGQRTRLAESRLGAGEDAALVALARAAAAGVRAAAADSAAAGAAAESEIAGGRVPGLDRLVQHLEAERSEVAVTAARAADEVTAAASEAGVADARVAELADAVRSDDADEGPEPDAADAERVEREIVRLERRVGALGPVNALAPEQHSALLERTSTVRADHDDLAGACADLRAIADHVAAEIEGRFDAVFGAVGYHFQLLFSELFPGGHAALRLEQPELFDEDAGTGDARVDRATPRQPGVEILAQPPGKRLQNLSLLSGGERALTALAVILALQQVNPSPFYVFDEVDAPLDDANIGRFTRLLRRLATEQQFLVVTHNHATMAAADSLYGVTMGTDGVSRIISVRLVAGEPVAVAGSSGSAAG